MRIHGITLTGRRRNGLHLLSQRARSCPGTCFLSHTRFRQRKGRHDRPLRLAFTFPDSGPQGKTFKAVAWEEDGQVWLGSTDPLAPAGTRTRGEGANPGVSGLDGEGLAKRRVLDRLLLQAVTPY